MAKVQNVCNELWKYFLFCGKGIIDRNRRKKILKVDTDDCLMVNHYGELNGDKLLYYIEVNAEFSGWFSIMSNVVSALVVAQRYGLKPIIKLGHSALYSEDEATQLGENLFEYYYEQPEPIPLESVMQSKNVICATNVHCSFIYYMKRNYDQDSIEMCELAKAVTAYLHLNKKTDSYITREIERKLSGNRIIGVHVRGTDFKAGFNNHAIYVKPEEYIQHVKYIMKDNDYDQIFLATDEESTIQTFQKEFGDKVVFHEVYRAKGNTDIGIHCTKAERPLHHYKLGLEVLLDMYSLAYCDALVACPSGVSFHAIINKRASGQRYEIADIIDKGRYRSRKSSVNEIRKNQAVSKSH